MKSRNVITVHEVFVPWQLHDLKIEMDFALKIEPREIMAQRGDTRTSPSLRTRSRGPSAFNVGLLTGNGTRTLAETSFASRPYSHTDFPNRDTDMS